MGSGDCGEARLRFVGPGTLSVTSSGWLCCLEFPCLLHEVGAGKLCPSQMAAGPTVDGPGAGMACSEGLRGTPQRGKPRQLLWERGGASRLRASSPQQRSRVKTAVPDSGAG